MPPVVIDATLQIRIVWLLAGLKEGLSVLHANIGGATPVNAAMANTISQAVADAHDSSGLNAVQPDTVQIDRVEIRDIRTPWQPIITGTAGMPSAGTIVGGDLLPKANALVVTHRTALAGPRFRGRTFLPGFDEAASAADGTATTAARNAARGFLEDLQTSMQAEGWPLGVASLTGGLITNITGFDQRVASWGSQRRRRAFF